MKETKRRIKKYKWELLVTLIAAGLMWVMPEPVDLFTYALHVVAFGAVGFAIGKLFYDRIMYCKQHTPIITRVRNHRPLNQIAA